MSTMKTRVFICLIPLFIALLAVAQTPEKASYLGAFSNESEGFYVKQLIMVENGKCLYQGVPALWKRDPATEEFTITFPKEVSLSFYEFKLRFEPSKRTFTILDPKIAEGSPPLHHISVEIPDKVYKMLKNFDGTMKSYHE